MPPEADDNPQPIAEDAPSPIPAAALAAPLPVEQEEQATSTPATGITIEEARRTIADILEQATGTITPINATSANNPVTDTTYDANKPPKPTMGGLVALSKTEWSAWTGGKPTYKWNALDTSARTYHTSPNQLRPPLASSAQKGYNYRRTGLSKDQQYIPNKTDLTVFQNAVWKHLRNTGMDTISYLPDPEDPTKMTSVVLNHARYTLQTAKKLGTSQLARYDAYDATNDDAARTFLLESITQSLANKIEERLDDEDPFYIVWLEFIKTIQSTSVERFEDLKLSIKNKHPSQYPGENLELLGADFRKDARLLTTAGQYDHNLTLSMLKIFLLAGGSGNEDYRFPLRSVKQDLDKALLEIGYKEKSAANAYMCELKLTYKDICQHAEDTYRTLLDRKEWPPARNPRDQRTPPMSFGHLASNNNPNPSPPPETALMTRAEVMNLMLQHSNSSASAPKGNCHRCGKPGHWSRNCPDNSSKTTPSRNNTKPQFNKPSPQTHRRNTSSQGGNGGWTNTQQRPSWRHTPPPPGSSTTKKVKERSFNWCDKCRRWTTTHTTGTHTGEVKSSINNGTNHPVPSTSANFTMIHDPSVWLATTSTTVFSAPTTTRLTTNHTKPKKFLLFGITLSLTNLLGLILSCNLFHIATQNPSFLHVNYRQAFTEIAALLGSALTPTTIVTHLYSIFDITINKNALLWFILFWSLYLHLTLRKRPQQHSFSPLQQQRFTDLLPARPRRLNPKTTKRFRTQRRHLATPAAFLPPFPPPDRKGETNIKKESIICKPCQQQYRYGNGNHGNTHPLTYAQPDPIHSVNNLNFSSSTLSCYHTPSDPHDTLLRMALQAPVRFRNTIANTASLSKNLPIIWDSGASVSISPNKSDFTNLSKPAQPIQLRGIARGLNIQGQGTVAWCLHDANGTLRTLQVPAYYVPEVSVRLLSTTNLLQTYTDESIKVLANRLILSGNTSDPTRNPIIVMVNPTTNLPTSEAYNPYDTQVATMALNVTINEVHEANYNLSEPEKELLRWHYRLGHISFRKIQFLFRSGILSRTELSRRLHSAAYKLMTLPRCAACQFGKQHRRPAPSTVTSVVHDNRGALKTDDLLPGQCISVDHFLCNTKGRLFTSAGKTKSNDTYAGGCLFVDHATGYVHVEHQTFLTSHETLKSKNKFELKCRDFGVMPQTYLTDNHKSFTSAEYSDKLKEYQQVVKFAGVGAHHHNGIAERNIRTIVSIARTMMLHSAIHWPQVADSTQWPMAVSHAVYLHNHFPNTTTGLSPADLFTKIRWEQKKFHDLHVWGAPVYVLDKALSDGKKIPRWTTRSTRMMLMGMSPKHSTTVPLVLNPTTGFITAQFHVVFDDWFTTVSANDDNLPDFNSPTWAKLFGESAFQYPMDEQDLEEMESEQQEVENQQPQEIQREERVAQAFDLHQPPTHLPVVPNPTAIPIAQRPPTITNVPQTSVAEPRPNVAIVDERRHETQPVQHVQEPAPAPTSPTREQLPSPPPQSPPTQSPVQIPPPTPAIREQVVSEQHVEMHQPSPIRQQIILPQVTTQPPKSATRETTTTPRRSTRSRAPPRRFGYDGTQGKGYLASHNETIAVDPSSWNWLLHEHELVTQQKLTPSSETLIFKAATSDPDTLTFDEAMSNPDELEKWKDAASAEIQSLEKNGTWQVVNKTEARGRILPGTWVFRRKRTPDGTVSKFKARYCVRGDLEDVTDQETFAPVVAWSTVRLFLVLSLTLKWETCTIDFSSAFVQAPLKDPVWIHLPRGFQAGHTGANSTVCLRLLKSLYGLSVAPRLWYQHLREALLDYGFKQCHNDPCLMYTATIMVVVYVDDLGIAYANANDLAGLFKKLEGRRLAFTREGSFTDFLGIKFTRDIKTGTLTLTQKGLITKILEAAQMTDCKPNWTPAPLSALGIDPDGTPMSETWSYRSIIGMLLYLSTNTRPDITFAVSQVARFSHAPKQSHATAVKMILRYLKRTMDFGMTVHPTGTLDLETYVDADFAGLHGRDPEYSTSSAKSRTGYLVSLGNCPIIWKSHLQTEITLSTLESEYSALSSSLRIVLPLRDLLAEITTGINLPKEVSTVVKCRVFEDNNGALLLATQQKITNRTKYFRVKWHHFWEHVRIGTIEVQKIATTEQRADYLTKGLPRESFERIRKLVQGW